MRRRGEGMKALPLLAVPGIDNANVKDILQAPGDEDVLHRRCLGGKAALVVQTRFHQFPEGCLREGVPGSTGIEIDFLLTPLEAPSPEKVVLGWILDRGGEVAPQILWENI